jgi:ring-1,2-phenylacetyl-CoA epoxidase subunit PaaE
MFIDDLYELKNCYAERLQLHFLFSQEDQEFAIFGGRLDGAKVRELHRLFCGGLDADEAFICGPDTMIDDVSNALGEIGMARENIHVERYGAPRKGRDDRVHTQAEGKSGDSRITVIMDGHRKEFPMAAGGESIVDGAARHGIELPYSCKGGVCATCRTLVRHGDVQMDSNFGLESWEVEKGYVLACQSHPLSAEVTLDYDEA